MNEEDMFHVADQKYAKLVFTSMHKSFRAQAQICIKHYNNTYGKHWLSVTEVWNIVLVFLDVLMAWLYMLCFFLFTFS